MSLSLSRSNGVVFSCQEEFSNSNLTAALGLGKNFSSYSSFLFSLGTHVLARGGRPLPSRSKAKDDDEEQENIDRDVIFVPHDDERRVGSFQAGEFESFRVAPRHPVNASR
jgi:hypothetical protein